MTESAVITARAQKKPCPFPDPEALPAAGDCVALESAAGDGEMVATGADAVGISFTGARVGTVEDGGAVTGVSVFVELLQSFSKKESNKSQ